MINWRNISFICEFKLELQFLSFLRCKWQQGRKSCWGNWSLKPLYIQEHDLLQINDARGSCNPIHCDVFLRYVDVFPQYNQSTSQWKYIYRSVGLEEWAKIYSWWRHQMGPFSALLALCAGNSPVPVNSPHNGQWRGVFVFSLICVWINGWVNYREAGDLRRHRAHYGVIVMCKDTVA